MVDKKTFDKYWLKIQNLFDCSNGKLCKNGEDQKLEHVSNMIERTKVQLIKITVHALNYNLSSSEITSAIAIPNFLCLIFNSDIIPLCYLE